MGLKSSREQHFDEMVDRLVEHAPVSGERTG
jgi:hypothetical protein